MNIEFSIHDELPVWGKWAASCTPNSEVGCYKSQPFLLKLGGGNLSVSESRLEDIDAAISRLFSRDEALIEAIKAYYVIRKGYRDIAEMLNRNPNWCKADPKKSWNKDNVKQWLSVAVAQLEGYLFAKKEAA